MRGWEVAAREIVVGKVVYGKPPNFAAASGIGSSHLARANGLFPHTDIPV